MAFTNQTAHYGLPQWVGDDKPTFLVDMNGAYADIDTAIYEAKQEGLQGQADASTVDGKVTAVTGRVETLESDNLTNKQAINSLETTVAGQGGSINTINSLIGNGEPTTSDKTLIGAINELDASKASSSAIATAVAPKANKSNITSVIASGTTNETGATIVNGSLFYLDGDLCKALIDIAVEALFVEHTNYEVTTIEAQLGGDTSALANKTDITSVVATGSTNTTGATITNDTIFYLNGTLCKATADIAVGATFTSGTNYTSTNVVSNLSSGGGSATTSQITGTTITPASGVTFTVHKQGFYRTGNVVMGSLTLKDVQGATNANGSTLCDISGLPSCLTNGVATATEITVASAYNGTLDPIAYETYQSNLRLTYASPITAGNGVIFNFSYITN